MGKLVLKNPYFEEEITVKEDRTYFEHSLDNLDYGNVQCIRFHQIEPDNALITINPKNFSKVEFYEENDNGVSIAAFQKWLNENKDYGGVEDITKRG